MVWWNLQQLSCGGEMLTNVLCGVETWVPSNGILSRNKRLKLSDSSSSESWPWKQAWKKHSGATESQCAER